ncbi:hypothetical protein BJ322DRAFT_1023706 [Thelephora terrestris]|uniref:Uncharacterized protein n=1 Tax=Thelephora terrestris TaxID=56493 RepID=A0A9P6L2H2_9AGAM|nr:hypothetical protein BJ322DRAFT_1023706 [Thelephora terrestris]
MNPMASHPDFLGDLDALLVKGDPTLEELEMQAFGRRVTGHLDGLLIQPSALPCYPESYPHPVDSIYHADTPHIQLSPAADGLPQQTNHPLSPIAETPANPPVSQPSSLDKATYVMELHVITKAKGKTRKATKDFRAMKAPTKLSFELSYVQFFESVVKVAGVRQSQLDHERMRWKHQKPASSPLTNISEDKSYRIMVQAAQSKKVADHWIIVEMGKPFLSEAISLDSDLEEIIEQLKAKYPVGKCQVHPNQHCFSTPNGKDHWVLDHPKLVTWAGSIVRPPLLFHFSTC